jgi:hypothetical protein
MCIHLMNMSFLANLGHGGGINPISPNLGFGVVRLGGR